VYFVESSTTSEIIDSRLEATVSTTSIADAISNSDIVGPRGPYAVIFDVQLPLRRSSQSLALNVNGFVQASDNERFRMALEKAWVEMTSNTGKPTTPLLYGQIQISGILSNQT
jgi:hypothetical protein